MKRNILILILSLTTFSLFSNNIQLSNASLTGQVVANQTVQVKFDLSWDNAWRTSTAVPLNWDAAWVFVKYRVGNGDWHHAKINPTGFVEPGICSVDVASDSTGAFIHLSITGNGNVSFEEVELQWNYGANGVGDDDQVEIKVFAIEMVYIPAGPFYIGDGLNETSRGQFHEGGTSNPWYISSEDSIPCGNSAGQLSANNVFTNSGYIPTAYPKGFNAYYCMKYEISQEQYVEFLNTLTRDQQNFNTYTDISGTSITNYFVMANQSVPSFQTGIRCDATIPETGPVTFYMDIDNDGIMNEAGDGHTLMAGHMPWTALAAYLDWAALRPMTEFEYEKTCRGPKYPVQGEYAWGTTEIHTSAYTVTNYGFPDAAYTNPGTLVGNANYNATKGVYYAHRCGIFASSAVNSSRQETGSGYYGCMELTGNADEQMVRAAHTAGRSYTGLHGNGELNASGHADTDNWPGINGNSSVTVANGAYNPGTGIGVTNYAGICYSGGSCGQTLLQNLRTSDRFLRSFTPNSFTAGNGGRGCRTAP